MEYLSGHGEEVKVKQFQVTFCVIAIHLYFNIGTGAPGRVNKKKKVLHKNKTYTTPWPPNNIMPAPKGHSRYKHVITVTVDRSPGV